MKKKSSYERVVETVNEIFLLGEQKNLGRFYTEDETLDGRIITANGKKMINFGSCGYLGLELDPRLKEAAIEAVHKYGTLYASSRSYVSTGNYLELEDLLTKMFNAHILLTTNVSLGHHTVMPIVIGGNDMVIYDQQAHISMHELAYKMKHFGTEITILRHNRLDELETKIEENKSKYDKIWYVIDGVYSMFGDLPNTKELIRLLNKHKKMHLYIDDAHGMSWAGPNGTGYTMSQVELHPKMVLATSIAKGFGSCGGVFAFKDKELRDKVRRWGGPLTYSGPQEPATVGAAIAAAKIHLSDEIYTLQNELQEKIQFCNDIMAQYKVPIISNSNSPIFYVGLGLTKMGYNMIGRIIDEGYYTNLGVFPAVPETCTGMRFTITNHIRFEDIEGLAKATAYHLPKALKEEDRTMKDIFRAFRKFANLEERLGSIDDFAAPEENPKQDILHLKVHHSIKELDKEEWNTLLGDRGAFDYDNLLLFEQVFHNNEKPENNWEFFYYTVRDQHDVPVVVSFFTLALNKDDMLAPSEISEMIEKDRQQDPYYLTSKYFIMGTLLTNGNHLYVNKKHNSWKTALTKLLDAIWEEQDKQKANTLYLRDFDNTDEEIISFLMDHGFIKVEVAENNFILNPDNQSIEGHIDSLPHKKRQHLKRDVFQHEADFKVAINDYNENELQHFFTLYKNVKESNLNLNTFALPFKLFKDIHESNNWEVVTLRSIKNDELLSVIFCMKNQNSYCPVVIGMNYDTPRELNVYKQSLFQVIKRGFELGSKHIYLGITATETKRKLGVEAKKQLAFVQIKDHFNMDLIESMEFSKTH